MPSSLAPDPIRVQSCVCCLFWTNRNSMAVTSILLSISLAHQSYESFNRRYRQMEVITSTEAFKGTVGNRICPSLHRGSLEFKLTVPFLAKDLDFALFTTGEAVGTVLLYLFPATFPHFRSQEGGGTTVPDGGGELSLENRCLRI